MNIPAVFKEKLEKNQSFHAAIMSAATSLEPIYKDNALFFFEEYTNHGIDHIENVLNAAAFFINEKSLDYITDKEIGLLILSVLLHDIGMHLQLPTFKSFIAGEYDDVRIEQIDSMTWRQLWKEYLIEVRHFSSLQKENIFGDRLFELSEPDLDNKDKFTGSERKLIGEFIRRHHARIAHEIALKGFVRDGDITDILGGAGLSESDRQLAGIIARSHGGEIRETFEYLKHVGYDKWKFPEGHNVIFLMMLLRLADYMHLDSGRTNSIVLKLKSFNSPISKLEHQAHLAVANLSDDDDDPESIYVTCKPQDARTYVKLQKLIKEIQRELDMSWAVLGEIYGFNPNKKPRIKYRRIKSNLENSNFLNTIAYIPQEISFKVNDELSKLLVAPLYGNKPTYGVRELVQNATDACKEYASTKGKEYEPKIIVSVKQEEDEKWIFRIEDNGKGMTLDEILNYFLNVGSSFRSSLQWQKDFGSKKAKRNGRFGIGVLAAFLIGDEISVRTKSYKDKHEYSFSTRIDGTHIDVTKKTSDKECGTEITIPISDENIPFFEKAKKYDYREATSWSQWYVEEFPKVVYSLNSEEIKGNFAISTIRPMQSISPKDFGTIRWGYKGNDWPPVFIACNGIKISDHSHNNMFSKYTNSNYVINRRPSLFIEDYSGILPVRLDRNDVDSVDLPFDDELFIDVSKEFIAQLLSINVSDDDVSYTAIHPHTDSFIFTRDGYCLASDYTLDIFAKKFKNYRALRVICQYELALRLSTLSDIEENIVVIPVFKTDIKLTNQTPNVAPFCGGRILLKRIKFDNLFLSDKTNRLSNRARNSYHKEIENDTYIIYNISNYSETAIALNDFRYSSLLEDDNVQSIQELPLSHLDGLKYQCGEVLTTLLKKYLGDNVVIPYDMEHRKKLYPIAFEELKGYMP